MNETRPEATHRQRAGLGGAGEQVFIGPDGRHYAVLSNSCSDLVPTVQFGNVLVGPVTITRAVPVDPTPEELAEISAQLDALIDLSRRQQKAAEFVVGAERRVIQWAIDPSTKVVNPATGGVVTPDGEVPAEPGATDSGAAASEPPRPVTPSPMVTQT